MPASVGAASTRWPACAAKIADLEANPAVPPQRVAYQVLRPARTQCAWLMGLLTSHATHTQRVKQLTVFRVAPPLSATE